MHYVLAEPISIEYVLAPEITGQGRSGFLWRDTRHHARLAGCLALRILQRATTADRERELHSPWAAIDPDSGMAGGGLSLILVTVALVSHLPWGDGHAWIIGRTDPKYPVLLLVGGIQRRETS